MICMCRMVHDTDIVELELRSKRFSLAVRKKEALESQEPTVIYQVRQTLGRDGSVNGRASYYRQHLSFVSYRGIRGERSSGTLRLRA